MTGTGSVAKPRDHDVGSDSGKRRCSSKERAVSGGSLQPFFLLPPMALTSHLSSLWLLVIHGLCHLVGQRSAEVGGQDWGDRHSLGVDRVAVYLMPQK